MSAAAKKTRKRIPLPVKLRTADGKLPPLLVRDAARAVVAANNQAARYGKDMEVRVLIQAIGGYSISILDADVAKKDP